MEYVAYWTYAYNDPTFPTPFFPTQAKAKDVTVSQQQYVVHIASTMI